ncbi:MAM domain-containing glycosylphosphatidylinositol anchor protein 1-like [Cottoperca gobio]|uniref:MAM domain-containing glycosylphosphatidylinositol anchor protein 1-like n=1 Tax=Cottoperca gobio TaxID=56716 RepID=A0A6J2PEF7_COTGO|nr:MAM domain-containing glycosylphosphatidylinositol anchor protein 1-like [Cottoperca gobio]
MFTSGRPITLLLLCLLGSATSSPVSIHTPAPPLPSQILHPSTTVLPSPPSPTVLPSPPSPTLSVSEVGCPLTMSPSALVVRFGDPVAANCSTTGFAPLGWEVELAAPELTMDRSLVWRVDRMTKWSITPSCYVFSEEGGQCHIHLPLTVYKPPDNVFFSVVNHTGPMIEGHQYTLQCAVQDVAPVENLIVTFYRGPTVLGRLQPNNNTEKTPVTEVFTLNITSSKEDDGVQYWCEAKLELGPEGPQQPPVVTSHKLTATVLFGPQLVCPTKLQVKEGESLSCEVRGNPRPLVTWFRDGQVVALPTHSSREHAGKYTISAKGLLGQRFCTVEVEVLAGSGTTNSFNRHFLLAVLLIWTIIWL